MKIKYKDKKIEKLCTDFIQMKKFFSSELLANKMAKLMKDLKYTSHISDFGKLAVFKKYHYHSLIGTEIKSLRIDYSYRMTLTIEIIGNCEEEDTIQILEVTNHYGD